MLITKSTSITYENEIGGRIEFSPFSAYFPESIEEETKNNILINKTNNIHGENYVSSSLESRYITISGLVDKNSTTKALAQNLIKIINPTLKGKLIYQNEDERKEIDVKVEEIPAVTEDKGLYRFDVSLMACNPFWKNVEKVENIAIWTPKFHFPLVIPKNRGIVFGVKKSAFEKLIENEGDVESGFRVVFKARSGTVKNPNLFNKLTGEYIKINYNMEKGDSIEVVSYPEKKMVTVNSMENGFRYLDIESTFFSLEVGRNILKYGAGENMTNLDVILYYTPRFLGV